MALIRVWLESVPGFADFAVCVHFPAILSNDRLSQFSVKQIVLMFSASHNWVFGSSWPFSLMWLSFSLSIIAKLLSTLLPVICHILKNSGTVCDVSIRSPSNSYLLNRLLKNMAFVFFVYPDYVD